MYDKMLRTNLSDAFTLIFAGMHVIHNFFMTAVYEVAHIVTFQLCRDKKKTFSIIFTYQNILIQDCIQNIKNNQSKYASQMLEHFLHY